MLMDNHIADECRETIIKCIDYQQAGCNFEGKRASYKQHLNETCRFHPCEKFNCKWRGLLQDRVGHVKNDCDWTVIDCTLGCGEQMERIDLSVHLEDQCKVNKQSIQKQKDIQRLESINKVQSKVSFEVHGREFCTTKENLKRYARESLLYMLACDNDMNAKANKNTNGSIFVCRDPHLFGCIMNWLATGILRIDEYKESRLSALKEEAEFWNLKELCKQIGELIEYIPADGGAALVDEDLVQISSSVITIIIPNNNSITDAGISSLPRGLTNLELKDNINITDVGIASLPRGLTSLNLYMNNNITDAGISSLPRGLTSLNLFKNNNITDAGISSLPRGLTNLELNYNRNITDVGIASLPKGLNSLNLYMNNKITDVGIASLPKGLTSLNLYMNNKITDAGIASLPKGLNNLNLYMNNKITDAGISSLPRGLTSLNLFVNRNITDAGIASLPKGLTSLNMASNQNITDAGIASLPRGLTLLFIERNQNITDAGIASLPRGCKVYRI